MRPIIVVFLLCFSALGQHLADPKLPLIEKSGFEPLVKALKGRIKLPLAIPRSLPKGYSSESGDFYCTVTELKSSGYEVIIGTDPECNGGNACRIGSLYGKRSNRAFITGTGNDLFDQRRARRVRLKQGIVGYFVDATCGVNCGDSRIFWRKNGWEYMVGLKAGKKADVIRLANSAIGSQQ